jgi:hypothetical protein
MKMRGTGSFSPGGVLVPIGGAGQMARRPGLPRPGRND